jgi:hypothetical protein
MLPTLRSFFSAGSSQLPQCGDFLAVLRASNTETRRQEDVASSLLPLCYLGLTKYYKYLDEEAFLD